MSPVPAAEPVTPARPRIGWLDAARGLALLAMASYHLTWDFEYFGYLEPGTAGNGLPKIYARAIATTFLFLAGFGLALTHRDGIRWERFWWRFAKVAGAALVISIATRYFMPEGWIHFGILHAIAVTSLIGLLFLRAPVLLTFAVAAVVLALPQVFRSEVFNAPWFWWTGLEPKPPLSFDYVPVFPWLAPVLLGLGAGRIKAVQDWLRNLRQPARGLAPIAFLGRHSLVVYLLHQIPLFGLVYVLSLVAPPDRGVAYIRECQATCSSSGSAQLCQRFCSCTLDQLNQQDLLAALQTGKVTIEDPRIQSMASQCSQDAMK